MGTPIEGFGGPKGEGFGGGLPKSPGAGAFNPAPKTPEFAPKVDDPDPPPNGEELAGADICDMFPNA